MQVATLLLTGQIRWNLSPTDPLELDVVSLGGSKVLNPLVFAGAADNPQIIPITAERSHVLTNQLSFRIPDGRASSDQIVESAASFLRTLRLISKQASLPTDFFGVQVLNVESFPNIEFPGAPTRKGFLLGSYRLATAVTMGLIERTDKAGLAPDIPICHEILLDALRACEMHNDREAILYAAIAVESLARTVLETEYQKVLAANPSPPHTNILSFPQAGGGSVRKDPIFILLADSENFSRLLHELPLYMLRRSLLQENQELYRRAISLYRTRNRLSHGRVIESNEEDLLPIDSKGAFRSLTVAIEVFQWFGVDGYFLPRMDKVPFEPSETPEKK